MLRARDAMDRDYAKPLDIPTLARIAYVSEAHFIRTFRATFGETPHRYLQRRRVEQEQYSSLRETDRSVTEICFDVGFTSLGTFSRTFTEILGEPPTTYRWRAADLSAVPACFAKAWTRPSSFGEVRAASGALRLALMPSKITHTQVYVLDQDEALDFYVGKLGFELNTDADLGFMRWLTINFPGQPDHQLLLRNQGPPAHDDATAEQIRELVAEEGGVGHGRDHRGGRRPQDLPGSSSPTASSSPRSRRSGSTAPTAGCATRSAIRSGSGRRRRARSRCRARQRWRPRTGPDRTRRMSRGGPRQPERSVPGEKPR